MFAAWRADRNSTHQALSNFSVPNLKLSIAKYRDQSAEYNDNMRS